MRTTTIILILVCALTSCTNQETKAQKDKNLLAQKETEKALCMLEADVKQHTEDIQRLKYNMKVIKHIYNTIEESLENKQGKDIRLNKEVNVFFHYDSDKLDDDTITMSYENMLYKVTENIDTVSSIIYYDGILTIIGIDPDGFEVVFKVTEPYPC